MKSLHTAFSFAPPSILSLTICCSIFVFKLYHKTCEQFYRNFGIYEKSPNSFLPGLPHSIVNQFDFHNFLCLCLTSVHLPYPFHLVSAFSFSVTPFRFASSGTISSMLFRAASSILAQYCLTYTQLFCKAFHFLKYHSIYSLHKADHFFLRRFCLLHRNSMQHRTFLAIIFKVFNGYLCCYLDPFLLF